MYGKASSYVVCGHRKKAPKNVDVFNRSVKVTLVVCSRKISGNVDQTKYDDDDDR